MRIEGVRYLFADTREYMGNLFRLRKSLKFNLLSDMKIRGFTDDKDVLGQEIIIDGYYENDLSAGEVLRRVDLAMGKDKMDRAKIYAPVSIGGDAGVIGINRRFRITN